MHISGGEGFVRGMDENNWEYCSQKKKNPKLNINNGFFLVFKMLCEESVCVTAVKILAPSLMTKAPLM